MRHIAILITIAFAIHCGPSKEVKDLMKQAKQTFGTIPDMMPGAVEDTPERIALGKKLYMEKRLSSNDSQSCNSCHMVDKNGVDNKVTSPGALGKNGDRNSPTSFNAGYHIAQFWDGRANDLTEQAKGPILNPVEMNMPSEAAVMKKLKGITEYPPLFKKAFPKDKEPMTYQNLAAAIASFERTLRTHDRFDDFMNGDHKALSAEEQAGLKAFQSAGCTACHSGNLLGGHMYQKMGLVNAYENKEDLGRYNVTKQDKDKYVFKVPSLRNIANTGPYFHDGKSATLEDAVKQMGWLQLGKKLDDATVKSIVSFLGSLSNKG